MKSLGLSALLFLALICAVDAQSTIFIVRHAEKADSESKDPDLSEAGNARAQALARMLKDAGITRIFTTEFKRTQQTAGPLAKLLGLEVKSLAANDSAELVTALHDENGNALVVGHTNTIPDLIKALGIATPIAIPENEYDDLFVIRLTEKLQLIRLHYQP
jgi:broad specificity phosphatase PhoE